MFKRILFFLILAAIFCSSTNTFAFWMWTPETNKWVNPKFAVKETPRLQLEFAQKFTKTKDYKKAIAEFNKLIANYPRSKEAPEAQYYIALCLEEQDKLYEAFKAYQKVVEKYPFSERSGDIVEQQFKIGEKFLEGGGKKNTFVQTVVGGEYDVVDVFRTVIKNAPYGPHAAAAQYKIGLYLQGKQLYQEARDEFEKVTNDYPQSDWAKAAQYQIALVDASRSSAHQYDQKITQVAEEEFKELVKTNPDVELSQKAQKEIQQLREKEAHNNFIIAHFYEKQKNYKSAKIYYAAVVDKYKNTSWAVKALEKIRALDPKIK